MKKNLTYLLEHPHEDNAGAWVFNLTYYVSDKDETVTIAKARFRQYEDGTIKASLRCELPGSEVLPVEMIIPAQNTVAAENLHGPEIAELNRRITKANEAAEVNQ